MLTDLKILKIFVLVRRIPFVEFRDGICLLVYMKTRNIKEMMKMNRKKIINSKQPQLMAVVFIAASLVTAMMIGINNSQNLQKAMAEEGYPAWNKHNNRNSK